MGIAKMNKVYLVAHQAEKDQVLAVLQQLGVVEVSDLQAKDVEDQAWAELVEGDQEQEALQSLEARLADVRFSLDFLKRYYPEKKSMMDALNASKMPFRSGELYGNATQWGKTAETVYSALKKIDEKLMSLRNEETRLQNLKLQLKPWEVFTVPLEEIKTTTAVRTELGTLPTVDVALAKEELLAVAPAFYLEEVNSNRGESFVVVAHHTEDAEDVQAILKQHNFNRHTFAQLSGTAAENLARIEESLINAEQERQAALESAGQQAEHREQLNYYLDYLTVEKEKKQVVANFARTGNAFILEGWVRTDDLSDLTQRLADTCDTVEVISRDTEDGEMYPVALENKKIFAPFEFITKLYDHPSPYGLDPTPAMAPFFVVFFGLSMTDAGYGVVLALLGVLGLWKIKTGAARNLMWILVFGGLSTIVFGWLVGGWFGLAALGAPLIFNAMEDPMQMLIYALAIGIVQIFFGMAIQAWRLIKQGKIFAAIFDVGLWYLLFFGFAMFALPQTVDMAMTTILIAVAGLVLTQGRTQPGIVKKFLSGLLSLYNITGYLSDVLSYSRLMALGLATGVIALAINTMAGLLTGHPIGYVLMVFLLLGGHIFNVVINTLGAYIHSSRLQYIEFYNRFYEGGGRAFVPFRLNTKNIDIQPEWQQR
jgi:V/A-type H+-transporting ATPase subunit I